MSDGKTWCRHYSGVALNKFCKIDVRYEPLRDENNNYPCFTRKAKNSCDHYEPYSKKELAEQDKRIADFLNKMSDFSERKIEDCIHCGRHVVALQQVGRCVYSRPCGCRLWQGKIPTAWRENATH